MARNCRAFQETYGCAYVCDTGSIEPNASMWGGQRCASRLVVGIVDRLRLDTATTPRGVAYPCPCPPAVQLGHLSQSARG